MPEYDMKLDVNFWADRNFRIKAKNATDAEKKLLEMAEEYYSVYMRKRRRDEQRRKRNEIYSKRNNVSSRKDE